MNTQKFVNFSNHKSEFWSDKQKEEALKWGEIVDVAFPVVNPQDGTEEIRELAVSCVEKIKALDPAVVMCQGEFTLTYAVINLLKEAGITVVSACSERKTVEKIQEDGTTVKSAVFEFIRFREYES